MKHSKLITAAVLGLLSAGSIASSMSLTGDNVAAEEKEGCKGKDGCDGKEKKVVSIL